MKSLPYLALILTLFAGTIHLRAEPEEEAIGNQIRKTLETLVEAEPVNPPGQEAKIVEIIKEKYEKAGIPFEITEFAPGRKNIVARLKGSGSLKPILILAHTDVVGVVGQNWSVPPHKVTEKDGFLYGRGVLDDLGMAATAVETLIALKKSGVQLKRDIIVALTGDEETMGEGVRYLLKNNPASIDAAFALNECGGPILSSSGEVKYVSLQVSEKIAQNYQIVAKGDSGHASIPLKENAILKIGNALAKISRYERPARLTEATRAYYASRAKIEKQRLAGAMKAVAEAKGPLPKKALKILEQDPIHRARLRTTCAATLVSGGTKTNTLPVEAKANLNCRILPDEDPQQIQKDLQKVIADDSLTIQMPPPHGLAGVPSSPIKGEGPNAIEEVIKEYWPKATIIPIISLAATDARYLRAHGIPVYGFNSLPLFEDDDKRAHGIDERIPADSLKMGAKILMQLLLKLSS